MTRYSVTGIRVTLWAMLVLGAILAGFPDLSGSIPRWVPALVAAVVGLLAAPDVVNKLVPHPQNPQRPTPALRLAARIGNLTFANRLRAQLRARGVIEGVASAQGAGLISDAEATRVSGRGGGRKRLRYAVPLVALLAAGGLFAWRAATADIYAGVGEAIDLNDTFRVTFSGQQSCSTEPGEGESTCRVRAEFVNVSGEKQVIGGGSFGTVGPKKPTYYYDLDPADADKYAIAAVQGKSFFELASNGFEGADLFDGEKIAVDLTFVTKRDTKRLDEVQLAVRGDDRIIHVDLS
jgi:hypothetical protein